MRIINETVLEMTNRDDLRTIELDYDYVITSELQLASILKELDYDYGNISTSENIQVFCNDSKFYTNGFDLLCALKL